MNILSINFEGLGPFKLVIFLRIYIYIMHKFVLETSIFTLPGQITH